MTDRGARTCDTSVLVAAMSSWHPRHEVALRAVEESVHVIPAHVLLECYSVLTRLPPPHRRPVALVAEALAGLDLRPVGFPGEECQRLVAALARANLAGGAVYDALVAATARHNRLTLVTTDVRAAATYEAVGVRYELLD